MEKNLKIPACPDDLQRRFKAKMVGTRGSGFVEIRETSSVDHVETIRERKKRQMEIEERIAGADSFESLYKALEKIRKIPSDSTSKRSYGAKKLIDLVKRIEKEARECGSASWYSLTDIPCGYGLLARIIILISKLPNVKEKVIKR